MKRKRKYSGNTGNIVRVDPLRADPGLIHEAAGVIGNGGVVVFPTSGLYGVGADAFNPDAVARVFAIKRKERLLK